MLVLELLFPSHAGTLGVSCWVFLRGTTAAQVDSQALFYKHIPCCYFAVVLSLHIITLCLLAHTLLQQVYSIFVTEGK